MFTTCRSATEARAGLNAAAECILKQLGVQINRPADIGNPIGGECSAAPKIESQRSAMMSPAVLSAAPATTRARQTAFEKTHGHLFPNNIVLPQ
jgi:hypothetical protein